MIYTDSYGKIQHLTIDEEVKRYVEEIARKRGRIEIDDISFPARCLGEIVEINSEKYSNNGLQYIEKQYFILWGNDIIERWTTYSICADETHRILREEYVIAGIVRDGIHLYYKGNKILKIDDEELIEELITEKSKRIAGIKRMKKHEKTEILKSRFACFKNYAVTA